jgi:hypothetical protein
VKPENLAITKSKGHKSMENKEQRTREEPKDPEQVENPSEAELDKVAGGGAQVVNTSGSNIKDN